jgi:hypothetical protein
MACYNSELPIGPQGPTGPQGQQGPPGESVALPYKVYTAWLSQTGTDIPIATEQYNDTSSSAVISRITIGQYIMSGEWDTYTADKVFCICTGGFGITVGSLINGGPDAGKIQILTYDVQDPVSLADFGANKVYIEIRLYL